MSKRRLNRRRTAGPEKVHRSPAQTTTDTFQATAGSITLSFALTCDVTHAPGALYEATGDLGHLDEHLALLDHALKVLPPEDPNLGPVHTNIASGQLQRFCRLGDPDDLTSAVAAARRGGAARRHDDDDAGRRRQGALRRDLRGGSLARDDGAVRRCPISNIAR